MEILAHAIRRVFPVLWLLSFMLMPRQATACSCNGRLAPCNEVAAGSAVFTGKVISVSPAFLNRLNRSSRLDGSRVAQLYNQLASAGPAQSLQGLKDTFRALVPALSPDSIQRLQKIDSPQELLKLFDSVLDHGSYVTLEVKTVFTTGGDDDHDNAALASGKLFGVWTPFFDCGVEFQTGETYLVYASMDEDTDSVETDTCMGTRRLSDAGADLPYLSFFKSDPRESGHLDGFVTSDSAAHANPPQSDTIPSPVGGILIELKSDDVTRYATSGRDGRFVFDGLADDSYELTGYSTEYPDPQHVAAGPDELRIKPKTCARHVLLLRPG